ncbi:hypothetical protein Hanom_Chr11g01058471 [Helianthus anomalus]
MINHKEFIKKKVTFQVLRMMMLTPVVISIKSTNVNWLTSTSLQLQVISRIRRKLAKIYLAHISINLKQLLLFLRFYQWVFCIFQFV